MTVLVGADPEFFVKENGKHISAYGLIEGTKAMPQRVNGGAVQVDGMALEFNINPAETAEEFDNNIETVIGEMHRLVPDKEFDFSPVATFTAAYMKKQPEDAKKLGCEPDFNAYTSKANDAPNAASNFRTASGHIHIGWTDGQDVNDPEHIEACEMFVRQMDVLLGAPSVLWDADTKRRTLYGKAGAYRPKPYGVEYRVLSNKWVLDRELRRFIFESVQYGFNSLTEGLDFSRRHGPKNIRNIINESNSLKAYDISSRESFDKELICKLWNKQVTVARGVGWSSLVDKQMIWFDNGPQGIKEIKFINLDDIDDKLEV